MPPVCQTDLHVTKAEAFVLPEGISRAGKIDTVTTIGLSPVCQTDSQVTKAEAFVLPEGISLAGKNVATRRVLFNTRTQSPRIRSRAPNNNPRSPAPNHLVRSLAPRSPAPAETTSVRSLTPAPVKGLE